MKKHFILFITLLCLLAFTGCKSKYADFTYSSMDKVTYKNILSLTGNYIVVAYQANCENCEDLRETVAKYVEYAGKHTDALPIYAININLDINRDILLLSSESYPKNMEGTTSYKNIKVRATPATFVINNGKLIKIISDYNTEYPVTDAKTYFNSLMK